MDGRAAGRTAATGLALLLTGGGCVLLAFGPALAPRPPFFAINVGARGFLGRELSDRMELRVAAAGDYEIGVRCRCLAASPCRIRAELRTAEGPLVVPADEMEIRSSAFVERTLFERPVSLRPLRRYDLVFRDASAGVVLDRVRVRDRETAWSASFEAESGHLSASSLVLLDPDASGGGAVGTLVAGGDVERTTQSFRAEADGLDGIVLGAVAGVGSKDGIRFRFRRSSDGKVLAEQWTSASEVGRWAPYYQLRFPPVGGSRGERFELEIEQPASHPFPIAVAEAGLYPDGELTFQGVRSTNCLLFVPLYASLWTTFGFIALGLAPFVIAAGFVGPRAGRFALAVLLPLVMLVSVANWQREYQLKSGYEWMPDGYDVFAQHVAEVVRAPDAATLTSLRSFLSVFPHAHSPVVPMLVGGLLGLGLPLARAYLIISFLFTVAGAWALLALLEPVGEDSWPAVWAVTCLGVTHFLFLRAAVRTSTDPAGYATVVIALLLAIRLSRQPEPAWPVTAAVILTATVALYTRPTALPLSLAIGIGFMGRRLLAGRPPRQMLAKGVVLALVPLALFFGGVLLAGLWPTFGLARAKAAGFAYARTPERYLGCLLVLAQLLWLPLVAGRPLRKSFGGPGIRWKETVLGVAWFLGLLAFLLVSPAPFWSRHFLHALPGLLILVGAALPMLYRFHPRLTLTWFWLHVGVNLAFMTFSLWMGTPVGPDNILS